MATYSDNFAGWVHELLKTGHVQIIVNKDGERELRFTEHAEAVVQDLINAGYAGRLRTKLNAVLIRS